MELLTGEKRRGRPRRYASKAERSREQRRRETARLDDLTGLFEALTQAFERAGCHPIFDHLPEEPSERIREAVRRLDEVKLVAFQREDRMQLTLPDTAPFSGRTDATAERSRQAAEGVAPKLPRRRLEALEWFASRGDEGGTDNALIAAIAARGGSPNGPRARRIELLRLNLLEASGEERDGCTVWRITDLGRSLLENG